MKLLAVLSAFALGCSSAPPRSDEPVPLETPPPATPPPSATVDAAVATTTAVTVARDVNGCLRTRETFEYRCSGVAPRKGESNTHPAIACDRCLADTDCAEQPGGRCTTVGGQACAGVERQECRYPSARCGGAICPDLPPPMPPSAAPR